ncbi:hypothetical protein P3G55_25400, partial [Leptospira sp. 96542]|nr:hypothetical protein [Leptospira sp. 96542]
KTPILTNEVWDTYFYTTFEEKKAGFKKSNGFATGGAQSLPSAGPRQLQDFTRNGQAQMLRSMKSTQTRKQEIQALSAG